MGIEIEEPFGILPLEAISAKAIADVIELVNNQVAAADMAAVDFEYSAETSPFHDA